MSNSVVDVSANAIDACPACGHEPAAVTALGLPAAASANTGGCLVAADAGEHYGKDVHPDYRPDVLVITHAE